MPKYRVTRQRHDISEQTVGEFIATNNEAAKYNFDKNYKKDKNWDWDDLKLIRFTEEIIEMSDANQRKRNA